MIFSISCEYCQNVTSLKVNYLYLGKPNRSQYKMVPGYEDPEVENLIDLSAIYNIPMLGICTVHAYENKHFF